MAYALVASTGSGSATGGTFTTAGINTTGANLIVVGVTRWNGGAATLEDSNTNVWTPLAAVLQTTTEARLYYCVNPVVGAGHTFTLNNSLTTYGTICVAAFSGGPSADSLDQQNSGGATATSVATGSVLPTQNGELLIAILGFDNADTVAINSGFTITNQVPLVAAQHSGGAMAYLIQTTAASVNPLWSWTNSTDGAARIATFKLTAGDPPPPTPPPGGRGRRRRVFIGASLF